MAAPSVSASVASIGAETSIASSIGPSIGPEFAQSFSSIPAPEIPSSIITEISRPAGMEFESLPEPIVGDFDIHDIISKPFVEEPMKSSFQTKVEPATFLDPKIVEEIYEAPVIIAEETPESIFEPNPVVQAEAILKEARAQIIEPSIQPDIEVADLVPATVPTPADQEVGSIATEIITLGAVNTAAQPRIEPGELPQTETQTDVQTLKKALSILQTSDFAKEEAAQWKEKLEKAVGTQALAKIKNDLETQADIETQTQTETQTKEDGQVENAAADGTPPPNLQTIGDSQFEPEDIQEDQVEEPDWNVYHINDSWRVAENVNKKRLELAEEIAFRAAIEKNPKQIAGDEIYKLDVPQIDESRQVLAGKLKRPEVSHKIYASLSTLAEDDARAVRKTIVEALRRNISQEVKPQVAQTEKMEESKLPVEVKELAAKGAKEIVLRNGKFWKPVKRLSYQEPIELQKAA